MSRRGSLPAAAAPRDRDAVRTAIRSVMREHKALRQRGAGAEQGARGAPAQNGTDSSTSLAGGNQGRAHEATQRLKVRPGCPWGMTVSSVRGARARRGAWGRRGRLEAALHLKARWARTEERPCALAVRRGPTL